MIFSCHRLSRTPNPKLSKLYTSHTLNPQPSTLNPQPSTLNPQPIHTLNPQPSTLNPYTPTILNPQPSTHTHPQSSTLNPRTLHRFIQLAVDPDTPGPLDSGLKSLGESRTCCRADAVQYLTRLERRSKGALRRFVRIIGLGILCRL
jgi:hypothetical protein